MRATANKLAISVAFRDRLARVEKRPPGSVMLSIVAELPTIGTPSGTEAALGVDIWRDAAPCALKAAVLRGPVAGSTTVGGSVRSGRTTLPCVLDLAPASHGVGTTRQAVRRLRGCHRDGGGVRTGGEGHLVAGCAAVGRCGDGCLANLATYSHDVAGCARVEPYAVLRPHCQRAQGCVGALGLGRPRVNQLGQR